MYNPAMELPNHIRERSPRRAFQTAALPAEERDLKLANVFRTSKHHPTEDFPSCCYLLRWPEVKAFVNVSKSCEIIAVASCIGTV